MQAFHTFPTKTCVGPITFCFLDVRMLCSSTVMHCKFMISLLAYHKLTALLFSQSLNCSAASHDQWNCC